MKHNNSFTLIELLVVIIILGILAAIAIPMYTNAIEQRRGEACANNIRATMTAWRIYNMNTEPDFASSGGFISDEAIRNTLNIPINENNFGEGGKPGFIMSIDITNQCLIISTNRLSGSYPDTTIVCNYFPNGTTVDGQTVYYVWSGTWPWISQIPQTEYGEVLGS